MKKIMFSALACVAFAFSGFASNEEVENVDFQIEAGYPCRFFISIFDSNGKFVDYVAVIGREGGVPCANTLGESLRQLYRLYPSYTFQVEIFDM